MKKRGKAISFILTAALVLTTVCIPMQVLAAPSNALDAKKVTITNNAGDTRDVIYITSGTKSGDVITVYKGGKSVFTSATARGASLRFEIPAGILDDEKDGTIDLTVKGMGKTESEQASVSYSAAPKSLPPIDKNIVVTHNVQDKSNGVYDRVNVTGLRSGDVFHVYYSAPSAGDTPIASSTTATTKGMAEATLKTVLPDGGSIWITVKSTGRTESDAVEVGFGDVDTTRGEILATATNNYGPNDLIMVTGLYPGDQIVAMEESTGVVYGSGKVAQRKTDIEISAKANRTGLLSSGGSIMIQITTLGKAPVVATAGPFEYGGEPTTGAINVDPVEMEGNVTTSGSVTIYNYENKLDQIEIRDLLPSDKILITTNPAEPQNPIQLKSGSVGTKSTVFKSTIKLPEIGEGLNEGSIRIYVTSVGSQRSDYVVVNYSLSLESTTPLIATQAGVTAAGVMISAVTNSAVKNGDSILVTGVEKGDKIMIYALPEAPKDGKKETTLNASNSGTVPASKTEVVILAQFPTVEAGSVYVSYVKPGLQESKRAEVKYGAEQQTSIAGISLSAVNIAGDKDTLTIEGATKDTVVQAYTANGTTYAATLIKGSYVKVKDAAKPAVATFAFPALPDNTGSGIIYVGIIIPGQAESQLIPVSYGPEPQQDRDETKLQVKAVNLFGSLDYVVFSQRVNPSTPDMVGPGVDTLPTVNNLYPGHTLATAKTVITLYASTDPAIKTKLGSLTINNKYPLIPLTDGFAIERTVSARSFNAGGGTAAYTLTYPGKVESARIPLPYEAEDKTAEVDVSEVQVINNINTGALPDYVDVNTGGIVTVGSIIKIYNEGVTTAAVMAKVTVTAKMASEAAVRLALTGKHVLGATEGSIWITVQEVGKSESNFVEIPYSAEQANQTPSITAVKGSGGDIYAIAINNAGAAKDFLFIYGLMPEDEVVLSYPASATKVTTQTTKVAAGQSTATFKIFIPDVAWEADNGYITVTRKGMMKSEPLSLSNML